MPLAVKVEVNGFILKRREVTHQGYVAVLVHSERLIIEDVPTLRGLTPRDNGTDPRGEPTQTGEP